MISQHLNLRLYMIEMQLYLKYGNKDSLLLFGDDLAFWMDVLRLIKERMLFLQKKMINEKIS